MPILSEVIKKPGRRPLTMVITWVLTLSVVFTASARSADDKFTINSGAELAAGSADFDVGYVPTPMEVVNGMFAFSALGSGDFLIDLGSGDGRIVITAAKRYGLRGRGVDLNPKLVALSKKYALEEGVADRTEFLVQDIFVTDIRAADRVTMYLLLAGQRSRRPHHPAGL